MASPNEAPHAFAASGGAARHSSLAVSVTIITRDEEQNLRRCLESLGNWVGEIVVLDCGSTDRTLEIAREFGARVHVEEFRGHVRQKDRAVQLAEHDWILALDADEELSSELKEAVGRALESTPPEVAAFRVARKTHYLGRFIEHGGWWPEWRVRLFDRRRAHWTGRDPHDRVEVESGEVRDLEGALHHYNYRDVRHHMEKVNRYTTTMARELHGEGRPFRLRDALLRPPARFLKMYLLKQGFRDGWRGFAIATIAAYYVFLKYVKLWELEQAPDQAPPKRPVA